MSEEQLAALLAKLKDDAGLQAKLKAATNLDSVLAIAKDAGFVISKAVWLKFQAQQTIELSDEELENVAGGQGFDRSVTVTGWMVPGYFCCQVEGDFRLG
jgi:predicted ribosomally synthesized peptide with nif11-like leader